MQVLSRNGLVLAGLMIAAAPALVAQNLPYGLKQSSPVALSNAKAKKPGPQAKAFKGQYAFALHGASVGGQSVSREEGIAGSITADGKGNIISGVEDFNSATGTFAQLPVAGSYTLDANGTGTLTLVSDQMTQTFSLYAPLTGTKIQNASLVQIDGTAGTGGTLVRQSPTDALVGNYSFNLSGETFETSGVPNAVSAAGTFNIIAGLVQGQATFFVGDAAHGGAIVSSFAFPANMTPPDPNGRFTLSFSFIPGDDSSPQVHFAGYVVDAKHFNLLPIDPPSDLLPLMTGSAVQ